MHAGFKDFKHSPVMVLKLDIDKQVRVIQYFKNSKHESSQALVHSSTIIVVSLKQFIVKALNSLELILKPVASTSSTFEHSFIIVTIF